jgi:hypothetical protein
MTARAPFASRDVGGRSFTALHQQVHFRLHVLLGRTAALRSDDSLELLGAGAHGWD